MSDETKPQIVSEEVQTRVINSLNRRIRNIESIEIRNIIPNEYPGEDCYMKLSLIDDSLSGSDIENILTQHNPYLYNGSAFEVFIRKCNRSYVGYNVEFFVRPLN